MHVSAFLKQIISEKRMMLTAYSRRYLVHREVVQYAYITYLKNYENAKSLKPDANKHGGDIHGHNTEPSAWVISSRHLMVVLSAINERLDEGVCGYCHGRTCTYTHTSKHACTHIYVHIHEHANAGPVYFHIILISCNKQLVVILYTTLGNTHAT